MTGFHHAHLFATDLDASVAFYRQFFDGRVVLDSEIAGARNVFMEVGAGKLHFYSQPPRFRQHGGVHHLGFQVEGLAELHARMSADGRWPPNEIRDFGLWKYFMVMAPDAVLLEVFEVDRARMPEEMQRYFGAAGPL